MRKHGFRSIFSLLLAVMMVCSLLPTAAFAEGNLEPADQVTEQPTDQPEGGEVQQPTEKKEDAPQGEQPATPPQTYTVVYADGAENTVFEAKSFPSLTSGAPTPAFGDDPVRDGYTFLGWEPALAETVTEDVTYTAKWEVVEEATDGALTTYTMGTPDTGDDAYGISEYKLQSELTITFYVVANGNEYSIGTRVEKIKGRYSEFECTIPDLTEFVSKNAYGKITDIRGSWYKPSQNKRVKVGDTVKWKDNTQSKDAYVKYYVDTYLVTGESWPITYRILYVSDDFNVGYNYGTKYDASFVCQYTEPHSNTASISHSLAEAAIKAAADHLASSVDEGYEIVGWTKTDSANPPVYELKTSGTTVWTTNNTIYIVAKKTVVNTDYNFTLVYNNNAEDAVGGPGSESYSASSSQSSLSHTFTISSTVPTREGYTFKGWSDTADGGVNYTAGGSYTMNATKDSPNPAATLYAVWEEEEITYTVTYTDGVEGEEVFQGRVYSGLKKDAQTPAFNTDGTNPTRGGYTFAGWNPEVAPTVTGNQIYTATWEPALPGAIFGSFTMKCVTTPKPSHYLIDGFDINLAPLAAYTNSGVQKDESGDTPTYYFELTVDAAQYLSQYDREAAPTVGGPIAHTIHDASQAHPVIRYNWNGTTWEQANKPVVEVNCAVTFTVTYTDGVDGEEVFANQSYTVELGKLTPAFSGTPTRNGYTFAGWEPTVAETVTENATYTALWMRNPAKPEGKDIPEISVTVDCVNTNANHEDGRYGLIGDYYTVTEPKLEGGVYSCTVEINGQKYVDHYSKELNSEHTLLLVDTTSPYVSVKLTGTATDAGYTWSVAVDSSSEVRFQAMCENVPPAQTFTVTYTDGVDSVEVFADQITENLELGAATPPFNGTPTREGYTFDGWEPEVASTVTGNATYVAQWTKNAPAKPTENDLAGIKVFVQCTNSGATHGDKRKEYGLIGTDGYYYVGNPTFLESDGKYHCTVNVNGERYVAKYSTDTGVPHTYMSVDTVYKYAYLTATWTDGGYVWSVDKDGSTVTFEARCETVPPAQTFTVTYKDGVAGKAFQDQSYTMPSGSATPAFNGTPYLAGYVFTDWTPAVATTVTANATYIATWRLDTNNNGKPDDEEERYTVTYTDGANGRAFASQVYPGLPSGTSTPKFNGTPVRSGYVFIGWSPVWSGTVTGNVTYTATWSTITGGLDKVPKTGDNGLTLALSALLLFSFCGAAACVVSTKKRG